MNPEATPFEPRLPTKHSNMSLGSTSDMSTADRLLSIAQALECPLCLSLICEPISISCGHSFCRVCLVKSLRRSKKKCPQCRAVCHVVAEDAEENIMLKALSIATNPSEYQSRLAEAEIEKSSWTKLLPIFYYNDCLYPGSTLGLHLFEPRYRLMMQRVVNTTRSFAYVPNFANYRADVGDVALIAQLVECEFLADGRALLQAKITTRHKITDHFGK
jgi:Zinc finger, C3HC4 type (RING finger)